MLHDPILLSVTSSKGSTHEKKHVFSNCAPAVTQEGMLRRISGWRWTHGYTDRKKTRRKAQTERHREQNEKKKKKMRAEY